MSVTLRVSSHQSRTLGADAIRVFARGGTIGRSPGNDWVLPDPERFVSSQHAVISLENGEYILTDRSTNGTIVNGRELAQGSRVRLSSGDTLTIGNYEISVSVDAAGGDRARHAAAMVSASHGGGADVPLGAPSSVDPLDFFSDPGPPSGAFPSKRAGAEPDHIPAEAEFFPPPRVERERSPHAEARSSQAEARSTHADARSPARPNPKSASTSDTGSGAFIPEDWDRTGFSMRAGDEPAAQAGDGDVFGATLPPPAQGGRIAPFADAAGDDDAGAFFEDSVGLDDSVRFEDSAGFDDSVRFEDSAGFDDAVGAADPRGDASASSRDAGGTGAGPMPSPGGHTYAAARPVATGASSPPVDAARRGVGRPAGDAGLDGLLRAAGLDPASVDAQTLASLGEILQVVVGGLMEVLRARAELKNQFRVAMTTLRPVENNPLKFSANAEDALFNLFARRGQSFKAPVDAFREAFDDLKAHQIAMMAGMRAAFGSLLKRFDPEELQTGFDRGLKRAAILDVLNKTKYWELYREMYEELGDDDTTFRRLFGDEFAQAYEEQMQRLTALHKR